MHRRSVVLVTVMVVFVAGASSIAKALGVDPISWQKTGDPVLQKILDLPANTFPDTTNFECTPTAVKPYRGQGAAQDCMVTVPFGQVGTNGVIFNGSPESIPVVVSAPLYGLEPIPNQSMLMTYSSGPIIGSYLYFYRSIRDKMPSSPEYVNGRWQYTITGRPDFVLRDAAGKAVIINRSAMAFSPNGSWMVVDVPYQGFVRINMATFEMLPFAPSLHQGNDYSDLRAQISVTNDGRQVALKPNNLNQFKVYDLQSCTGVGLPVSPASNRCAARDYWSTISSQITGFSGLYKPRFINDAQLSFSAVYDYTPANFKVASYTLTAPGEDALGIQYLGMGDSFASGEGAFGYTAETDTANNTCHLSAKSYAYLLTNQLFASGHSVACSGAVTGDITNASKFYLGQVKIKIARDDRPDDFINAILTNYTPGYLAQTEFIGVYKPQAITLSIGGNNIGFGGIVLNCVSPVSLPESCYPTYEDRLELARHINSVFDTLVNTYKTVAKPGKRVYIIGYPRITYPGGNCAVNVHLDGRELQFADDLIEYLNLTISRAAEKAGVRYVDVSNAFIGHRLCETKTQDVAVNGVTVGKDSGLGPLKFIGAESYHPNALGHDLLSKTIRAQTNNLQQQMPVANLASQAPALPAFLEQPNLPKSGRATNVVVTGNNIAPDLVTRNQDVNVVLDGTVAAMKAFTAYSLVMRSEPLVVGTATTDALGNLNTVIRIPATLPPGFHTLHIYGPNMTGQSLDIVKTVYVAASPDDYNGDGIINTSDPCLFLAASGQDVDKDGIDDACDGYIAAAPVVPPTPGPRQISSSVTLTGNSITITRSVP